MGLERRIHMTAEQLIDKIKDICDNSNSCDECPLNTITPGICTIDSMDWEKLKIIIKNL